MHLVIAALSYFNNFRSGPSLYPCPFQPRSEPVFQGKSAYFPEALGDRILLALGEVTPISRRADRLLDVVIDEFPANPFEARDLVAVDNVDAGGAVLSDQRCPLVRALPPADDQNARVRHVVEAH